MRKRIREALRERQAQRPEDEHLAGQLALLDAARIQTIHSFCLELVRQHFYELGIDPQVIVLDDQQAHLLARQTLGEVLRRCYEAADEGAQAVQRLIVERARGWDKPIRELVLRLHAYGQSLRDPAGWLARQIANFAQTEPTAWRQAFREGFVKWRQDWQPYLEALAADNPNAGLLASALEGPKADPTTGQIAVLFARIKEIDADWPHRRKTELRAPLKKFLEEADFWRSLLPSSEGLEPLMEDWNCARTQMLSLLKLARDFGAAYAAAKSAQGAVDFSDLEQFALRLLYDAQGRPSATAKLWQEKFRLIFVDEYQDINDAQDAILSALARTGAGANRFLVGDVKQSIYRFRLADPRIFQRYADQWRRPEAPGRVLPLSHNFRSHEGILDFVNALFGGLMERAVGGVAYDRQAELKFGAPEQRAPLRRASDPAERRRVELHLLLESAVREKEIAGGEEGEKAGNSLPAVAERTGAEQEARFVAGLLGELKHRPLLVWDPGQQRQRPVEWSDMVVLMRAPRGKAEIYAREFERLQVPLSAVRGGFFESIEVADLLNLLRLLDNPLQDLPLLAVLRSPLVGLTLDELAEIRQTLRKGRFWNALDKWHGARAEPDRAPDETAADRTLTVVDQFLERYWRWRALVRQDSLSACLEAVLRETRYAEWCRAQERGPQRQANVERLLSMARQFDPLRRQGLYRFLNFVEAQIEAEIETEPAPLGAVEAVRLMSIHQSKGLEFPVVVLAGLGAGFNEQDLRRDIIVDEQHGLCPKVTVPSTGSRYPGITHWLASRQHREDLLGEELRLLYVAATRACEHLILTGIAPAKRAQESWGRMAAMPAGRHRILAARSYLDWIGPWLPKATGCEDWLSEPSGVGELLAWTVHDVNAVDETLDVSPGISGSRGARPSEPQSSEGRRTLTPAEGEAISRRLRWVYPNLPATVEPAKTSVSLLRRRMALEDEDEWPAAKFLPKSGFERVRADDRLDAAEVGAAHHLFLQNVELRMAAREAELRLEAERMVAQGLLSPDQRGALDFKTLAAFWQSPVGLQIRGRADFVNRELPFTARLHARDLEALNLRTDAGPLGDEFVVVQGVADLVVLLPTEIWLLDFKTDNVRKKLLGTKINQYAPQLKIYGIALSRIYRRPVKRLWLHFLKARETVDITF